MNEVKPTIKGIIIDRNFLVNQVCINQGYDKQVLAIIKEAHSRQIKVIIRCESKKHKNTMFKWLVENEALGAMASDKNELEDDLFRLKLNPNNCHYVVQDLKEMQEFKKQKIQFTWIQSEGDFNQLLMRLKNQEIKNESSGEFKFFDPSGSGSFSSQGGSLKSIKNSSQKEFSSQFSQSSLSCSPGRWGIFSGTVGGIAGLVAGGGLGYFLWPLAKGCFPQGELTEISIKIAFALVMEGIGVGVGYYGSTSDCCRSSEHEQAKLVNSDSGSQKYDSSPRY